jgi:hypothetical protein
LPDGAVVVRDADAEPRLQGLRTALSLALGDRPATVYLVGDGVGVLSAASGTEARACLEALEEAGIPIIVEAEGNAAAGTAKLASRAEILEAIAVATFQQTF